MEIIARINNNVIRNTTGGFPDRGDWVTIDCWDLYEKGLSRTAKWREKLSFLGDNGGVYVFLLPQRQLKYKMTIHLHGPSRSKILFEFEPLPIGNDGYCAVYVGKAANLVSRWKDHLGRGDRKTSPLKFGLIDSDLFRDQDGALGCLHQYGRIIYHVLPGPENCANRDLIESALIARLQPPFNIKSEH